MQLTSTPQRAWVNQPSTLQPYHNLHGIQVLALLVDGEPRVWFLGSDVIDQQIDPMALSPGWPKPDTQRLLKTIDECDTAFAVINICDDLTPQARKALKTAWQRVQDDLIASGFYKGAYVDAVKMSRQAEHEAQHQA